MFGAAITLLHCGSCQLEVLEVSVSVEDPDISDTADMWGLTLRGPMVSGWTWRLRHPSESERCGQQ